MNIAGTYHCQQVVDLAIAVFSSLWKNSVARLPGREIIGKTHGQDAHATVFQPLENVPPQSGTRWRANFYRMDYDDGQAASWDWSRVGLSFHEIEKFGALIFE